MPVREHKKQQVRLDILAAASAQIGHKGYDQTAMRDIATAAGISYQTLYNYFPTKAQVLHAVLTRDIAQVAASAARLANEYDGDLLETLCAISSTWLDAITPLNRALWRVVTLEQWQLHGEAGQIDGLIDASARNLLHALLTRAQEHGRLGRHVDAALLAGTLLVLCQHAFANRVFAADPSKVDPLQTLQAQMELLLAPYLKTHGAH